jgi:hypothetical protein
MGGGGGEVAAGGLADFMKVINQAEMADQMANETGIHCVPYLRLLENRRGQNQESNITGGKSDVPRGQQTK